MLMARMPCSCGETVYRRDPFNRYEMIFQHGENPEHVMIVTLLDAATAEPFPGVSVEDWLRARIDAWVDMVHRGWSIADATEAH